MPKRLRNPSSSTLSKVEQAIRRNRSFSGHGGGVVARELASRVPGVLTGNKKHVLMLIGYVDGIKYTTVRVLRGKSRLLRYEHDFRDSARPLFATSHDGRHLYIVGGRFRFTARGIVDATRR